MMLKKILQPSLLTSQPHRSSDETIIFIRFLPPSHPPKSTSKNRILVDPRRARIHDCIRLCIMKSWTLFFLISCFSAAATAVSQKENPIPNAEALNLLSFLKNVDDPKGSLSSWKNISNKNPCEWRGVWCNDRGRVTQIVLNDMSLSGYIDMGDLKLPQLQKISLSNNGFTGISINLTSSLSNVDYIDISSNSFAGSMEGSSSFATCGSLRFLSVAFNRFQGGVPESLSSCSYLEIVSFASNQFSGVFPSPVLALTKLKTLDLSDNQFKGRIPEGVGGLPDLVRVNLSRNQLYGELPKTISNCTNLTSLDFSDNNLFGYLSERLYNCRYMNIRGNLFTGGIPEWIGEMGMLETLDISHNSFVGGVPVSFGKLKLLRVLNASKNILQGGFPSSLRGCSQLSILDLGRNYLSGYLPQWISGMGVRELILAENNFNGSINSLLGSNFTRMGESLEMLDLSNNELSGGVPSSIGRFGKLKLLNLSSCLLEGPLPEKMMDLKSLNVMDLGDNQLGGSIPRWIGNMASLEDLRLNKNQFSSIIPASIGNCSSIIILSLSENLLNGCIPSTIPSLSRLQELDLSSNNLTGQLSQDLSNLHSLRCFNISNNNLTGKIPTSAFFNSIDPTSLSNNPHLCGPQLNKSCTHHDVAKPIVLDPTGYYDPTTSTTLPGGGNHRKKALSPSTMIAMAAGASILVGVLAISLVNLTVHTPLSRLSPTPTFSIRDEEGLSLPPSLEFEPDNLVLFSTALHLGRESLNTLTKEYELGRGSLGIVYRALLPDGRALALKKLITSAKSEEEIKRVAEKLGGLGHRNMVGFYGYYWAPWVKLLINEYVEGGSLYQRLHGEEEEGEEVGFSWEERLNVIMGTARCLEYLHGEGVVHGDVRTSKVMVDGEGVGRVGGVGVREFVEDIVILPYLGFCLN